MRTTISETRENGATYEEIYYALTELVEGFGIDLPEGHDKQHDSDRFGRGRDKKTNRRKSITENSNYPNPFNLNRKISYTLQNPEHVTFRIYNIQGQLIRTFVNSHQPAGSYTVFWNGLDENSENIVSGVYIYCIDAGSESLTQRMILMK
ncbi:MAG: T9SS type A sorting domain-containing protein [Candidatus Marinimicrobia bacterium]|nr:T9SS type A sorting domain-containing protein [Candidatus Neomarinimicrobiota bacterium]